MLSSHVCWAGAGIITTAWAYVGWLQVTGALGAGRGAGLAIGITMGTTIVPIIVFNTLCIMCCVPWVRRRVLFKLQEAASRLLQSFVIEMRRTGGGTTANESREESGRHDATPDGSGIEDLLRRARETMTPHETMPSRASCGAMRHAMRHVMRQTVGDGAVWADDFGDFDDSDDPHCPLCLEPLCSVAVGVHAVDGGGVRVVLAPRLVFRCGRCRGAMHTDCACAMLCACASASFRRCLHCTAPIL